MNQAERRKQYHEMEDKCKTKDKKDRFNEIYQLIRDAHRLIDTWSKVYDNDLIISNVCALFQAAKSFHTALLNISIHISILTVTNFHDFSNLWGLQLFRLGNFYFPHWISKYLTWSGYCTMTFCLRISLGNCICLRDIIIQISIRI